MAANSPSSPSCTDCAAKGIVYIPSRGSLCHIYNMDTCAGLYGGILAHVSVSNPVPVDSTVLYIYGQTSFGPDSVPRMWKSRDSRAYGTPFVTKVEAYDYVRSPRKLTRSPRKLQGHHVSLQGHHVSLQGHHVSLQGHHVSLQGHHVSLHGHYVSLQGHHVSLQGHHVSLQGHHVSLHGHHVSLQGHHVSLQGHHVKLTNSPSIS